MLIIIEDLRVGASQYIYGNITIPIKVLIQFICMFMIDLLGSKTEKRLVIIINIF